MDKNKPTEITIQYFSRRVQLLKNDALAVEDHSVESCLSQFIMSEFHEELKKLNSRKYFGLKFFSYSGIVPEYSDEYKEGLQIIIFPDTHIKEQKKILSALGFYLYERGFENHSHFYSLVPKQLKSKTLTNVLK